MAGAAASLAGSLPRRGPAGKAARGGGASLPAVNYGGGTLSRAAVSATAGARRPAGPSDSGKERPDFYNPLPAPAGRTAAAGGESAQLLSELRMLEGHIGSIEQEMNSGSLGYRQMLQKAGQLRGERERAQELHNRAYRAYRAEKNQQPGQQERFSFEEEALRAWERQLEEEIDSGELSETQALEKAAQLKRLRAELYPEGPLSQNAQQYYWRRLGHGAAGVPAGIADALIANAAQEIDQRRVFRSFVLPQQDISRENSLGDNLAAAGRNALQNAAALAGYTPSVALTRLLEIPILQRVVEARAKKEGINEREAAWELIDQLWSITEPYREEGRELERWGETLHPQTRAAGNWSELAGRAAADTALALAGGPMAGRGARALEAYGESGSSAYGEGIPPEEANRRGMLTGALNLTAELAAGGQPYYGNGVADTALGALYRGLSGKAREAADRLLTTDIWRLTERAALAGGEAAETVFQKYLESNIARVTGSPEAREATKEELIDSGAAAALFSFVMQGAEEYRRGRIESLSDEDFDFVLDEIIVGDFTLPEALHTLDEKKMTQATFNDKVDYQGVINTSENSINNVIPDNESIIGHIFRNAEGHIEDTPQNRELLESVANRAENFKGQDKYGNKWYSKILEDGRQVWVEARNGNIFEGGINETCKPWNSDTGLKSDGRKG